MAEANRRAAVSRLTVDTFYEALRSIKNNKFTLNKHCINKSTCIKVHHYTKLSHAAAQKFDMDTFYKQHIRQFT